MASADLGLCLATYNISNYTADLNTLCYVYVLPTLSPHSRAGIQLGRNVICSCGNVCLCLRAGAANPFGGFGTAGTVGGGAFGQPSTPTSPFGQPSGDSKLG